MPVTREMLLNEARRRGALWGEQKFNSFGGHVTHYWPSMLNVGVNLEAHRAIADILPLDAFGVELVQACYEAARDTYDAKVKKGKAEYKGAKR